MPELDSETWGAIGFGIYYLIGLPIARSHVRCHNMTESVQRDDGSWIVIRMLAILWPVLLFASSANRAVERGKQAQAKARKEKSDS